MRVIQIGIDIKVDALTDIEKLKSEIVNAINFDPVEVMGIEQSDTSWSLEEYLRGEE